MLTPTKTLLKGCLSLLFVIGLSSCTSDFKEPGGGLHLGGMEFIRIDPGSCGMGTPTGSADQQPVRQIEITEAFMLAKVEFTQELWKRVTGETIQDLRDRANPQWSLRGVGPQHPVYYVSWQDVQQVIEQLNEKHAGDLPEGYVFALPTEAQWEYAARSRDGDRPEGDLATHAWFDGNSDEQCHEVGQKAANAWGLHDMYGNVWEWCSDYYGHYDPDDLIDPQGPARGSVRASRGASWHEGAGDCYASKRDWYAEEGRLYNLGFRLAIVRQN